jgi:hypothetical protein
MKYPFPPVIDNTMRSAFVACPYKFYLAHIRNRKPEGVNIHLHFGGAFAKGMEVGRRAFHEQGTSEQEAEARALEGAWRAFGDPPIPTNGSGANKDMTHLSWAIESYFTQYPLSTDPLQPHTWYGKKALEFSFAIPLEEVLHPDTHEPLIFAGRFDQIGVFQNSIYCVDEKTCSQTGPKWAEQWRLRAQFDGYCWAAKQHGIPVNGTLVRGVCILKKEIKHGQAILPTAPWRLERWHTQFIRDVQRMIEAYMFDEWDMNLSDACTSYTGCEYAERLCNRRDPEEWMDHGLVERIWNPLEVKS